MRKALLFIAVSILSANAWAATLFTTGSPTLGAGVTHDTTVPIFNCCSSNFTAAVGFSVPTGTSYQLDDIQVVLVSDGNAASPLSALLYADSGGVPSGSPVADLSRSICPCPNGVEQLLTLTPGSPFVLTPNTTYWLVLNVVPADDRNIAWVGTTSTNPYSGTLGFAGTLTGSGSGLPGTTSTRQLLFAVDGTAIVSDVPEPATGALIGLGLLAGLAIRHRRR